MRDVPEEKQRFEKDFDFKFEDGIRTDVYRIDNCRPVKFDMNRDKDVERQARIAAHTDRVQRELQESGITKGSRE